MKKILLGLVLAGLLVSVLAGPVSGASTSGRIVLYEKDPSLFDPDGGWLVVEGGAWGKCNYKLVGTEITGTFNGHGLDPNTNYTLVQIDGYPYVLTLGSGTTNENGNINFKVSGELVGNTYWIGLILTGHLQTVCTPMGDCTHAVFTTWDPWEYLWIHPWP